MDYQEIKKWREIAQLNKLLDLSTPPKTLFLQGKWNPKIFENCTAIVGSRKMTSYGQRAVEKIIPQLIQAGKTIVSGFMYGVDQYAHQVCVESGGLTIAVLGWGIDTKLSGEDVKLAKGIIETGGILLSEWQSQQPTHWTFPARNRIVAALSQDIIIVEAAEKSGSLITARLANKLKRTLWAVPGPITSRTSSGTNNLIAAGLAKMWLGTATQTPYLTTDDPIMEILLNEALTADGLARNLQLPVSEIGAKLSILLLSGQVIEKDGKYYIADVS
ncbi:MAG: DNA processing protein [Microgenomates group bacterium Gr01-1014_7]|nr:MAG: DNA processing protein [Microgenomates group bacterium Gr01-1014_7]